MMIAKRGDLTRKRNPYSMKQIGLRRTKREILLKGMELKCHDSKVCISFEEKIVSLWNKNNLIV